MSTSRDCEMDSISMASRIIIAIDFNKDRPCFGMRDHSESNPTQYLQSYSWQTFHTVGQRIKHFSLGLLSLIEPRHTLGICAASRPEWIITDLACILQSIISVPLYCQYSADELTFIINQNKIRALVCDAPMIAIILQIYKSCPSLRFLISMDPIENSFSPVLSEGFNVHQMTDVEQIGSEKISFDSIDTDPQETLSIIYTSGSSSFPKGAIISEQTFRNTYPVENSTDLILPVRFCYRPLAWITDRKGTIAAFLRGGSTGFSTGNLDLLMEELSLVKPTAFSAPPTFWNKIYTEFNATLAIKSIDQEQISVDDIEKHLQEFSRLIPRECRILSIGGAMASRSVINFMRKCFRQCSIIDSYGTTECGRIAFNQRFLHSVLDYRLESVPQLGYCNDDKPHPRGELLIKTLQMFSGYANDEEETKGSLTADGFYRTGDIVELYSGDDGNVRVRVIDRKKNFLKLSQGVFVSPERLEAIYLQSFFIEQIFVYANGLDDSVLAVVVPQSKFLNTNDQTTLIECIRNDFIQIAKKELLKQHEIPSRILIETEPFTIGNGFLTSSTKLCRYRLIDYYANRLKTCDFDSEHLQVLIEQILGNKLDLHKSLIHQIGDSLTGLRLSRAIETNLGISVSIENLFQTNLTYQQLVQRIKHGLSMTVMIDPPILEVPLNNKDRQVNDSPPSTIFMTGVTGFIGAFLLAEMLETCSSYCQVICLIRSKSTSDAWNRLERQMKFYQIWQNDFRNRIECVSGDLLLDRFGLDEQTLEQLSNRIDLIVHCAAEVNIVYPYERLRSTNVEGTRQIIELSLRSQKLVPIQYISSKSVLPKGIHSETPVDQINPNQIKTGYGQTKWAAEYLLIQAKKYQVPVLIYRLGSVGAHARTGICNINDIHSLFLRFIIKNRFYSKSMDESTFYQIPIDVVTKQIINTSHRASFTYEKQYYVIEQEQGIPFQQIRRCIETLIGPMQRLSDDEWREKLKRISSENILAHIFLQHRFQKSNTEEVLDEHAIVESLKFLIQFNENNSFC